MQLDDSEFDPMCPCGCGETLESANTTIKFNDIDEDDDEIEYDDPWVESTYDDDDDYDTDVLDDDEFISGASTSCPWEFSIPANMNKILSNEGSTKEANKLWSQLWPAVQPTKIDPAQAAADYYLMFGIINNSFVEFEPLVLPSEDKLTAAGKLLGKTAEEITKRAVEIKTQAETDPRSKLTKMSKDTEVKFHKLVTELDECFRQYVHMACGGELRHHKGMGPSLGGYRRGAWAKWYYIYKDNGPESLLKMADLFREFTGGGYGGPPWANAAEILYQREVGELGPDEFTNKQLFLDRVFTLEHNGGCFLNKLNWVSKREGREYPYSCHYAEMKNHVLEAHASNPVNIDMLHGFASKEIQDLTKDYLQLAWDHDIPIVGTWQGNTVKEKVKEQSESISVTVPKTSNIDWSDMEGTEPTAPVNPLVKQLEESMKKMNLKPTMQGSKPLLKWSDELFFSDGSKVSAVQDDVLYETVKWT